MGKNGYSKSLLDTVSGKCYVCGAETETARHEIFFGKNRQLSKQYGMWVNLCPACHNSSPLGVHNNHELDQYLKEIGQKVFEETYSYEKFMEIFGRSYL